jgi:signal transduction histidine kinase
MKRFVAKWIVSVFALVVFVAAAAGVATADDKETAVKLVKSAISFISANGIEKGLDILNDPTSEFVKGELYVFAYDLNGVMMANSFKQNLVGQNVLDVPDTAGKKYRREMVEIAKTKGSGWVDYQSQNPKTKKMEQKTTYVEKTGDLIVCCGIFK